MEIPFSNETQGLNDVQGKVSDIIIIINIITKPDMVPKTQINKDTAVALSMYLPLLCSFFSLLLFLKKEKKMESFQVLTRN